MRKSRTGRRTLVVTAALIACLAALPALGGCDNTDQSPADSQVANPATPVTSSGQDSGTSSSNQQASTFSPSDDLDENGHWKGVNALDYVTLCQYDGIPVPADVAPTDEEVQAQIDAFTQNNLVANEITDRAVADGDTVNIDYVGSIDGVEFQGGSTGGNGTEVTLGVTSYIPGFLEQLVGHTPGETFDIDVTFPEDYHATDLAGKDAVFTVTINNIVEYSAPEVTDEWVAANLGETYGWTTADGMRQGIADTLRTNAISLFVQDYVIDNSTISEVPAELITYQEQTLVAQYESYANMYGMDLSMLLPMMTGYQTTDELIEASHDTIERTAKGHLVFQAIAQDAGIEVTDDDVKAYLQTVAGSDDVEGFAEIYGMPYLKMCALIEKVGTYLVDHAVIEE